MNAVEVVVLVVGELLWRMSAARSFVQWCASHRSSTTHRARRVPSNTVMSNNALYRTSCCNGTCVGRKLLSSHGTTSARRALAI